MTLFADQQAAIDKLSRLRAGALFMEMGTGKTRTAIELAKGKASDFNIIIWIAPASLIREQSYQDEICRWTQGFNRKIHYFTIEGISQSDRAFIKMRSLAEENKVFCIVDESLTIKNAIAKRTRRLVDMWHLFDFRLILNGTPLSKGLIDLYSQIKFIHPDILGMNETQFAHNFLTFRKDGWRPWQRWSKPENEDALIEIVRPYIFDAELDLKLPRRHIKEGFRLTNQESADYIDFKKEYLKDKFTFDFLAVAQKFQQQYTLCNRKINWLFQTLPTLTGKTIIFVKFIKELNFIKENFDCLEYSGRQKDDLSRLAGEKNILACTYGTGAKGLNLQICQNIIFFSQTFDWAHKQHGLHRIYRLGQDKPITIYDLWVKTGLENLIKQSLDKKTTVANHVGRLIDLEKAMEL